MIKDEPLRVKTLTNRKYLKFNIHLTSGGSNRFYLLHEFPALVISTVALFQKHTLIYRCLRSQNLNVVIFCLTYLLLKHNRPTMVLHKINFT